MSLIDDVLILCDNNEEISLDNIIDKIQYQSKQIITSVLGRLTSKKFIEKKVYQDKTIYRITKSGKDKINIVLGSIKKYSPKLRASNSWHIVVFDIPEKNRSSRDAFRNYLIGLGFGKLQDSIWVSYHDQIQNIAETIKLLNISSNVTNISSNNFTVKEEKELINKISWDWKNINAHYVDFINNTKKFLNKKNKDSFEAKKLVFQFAKNLIRDPKLPLDLQLKNVLTHQAYELYLKIRPYCY